MDPAVLCLSHFFTVFIGIISVSNEVQNAMGHDAGELFSWRMLHGLGVVANAINGDENIARQAF